MDPPRVDVPRLWHPTQVDKRPPPPPPALITPSASPSPAPAPARPSPAKRARVSERASAIANIDIEAERRASIQRLYERWEALADRYARALDEDDVIDLHAVALVKDRGVVRGTTRDMRFGGLSAPTEVEEDDAGSEDAGVQTEAEGEGDGEGDESGVEESADEIDGLAGKESGTVAVKGLPPPSEEELREFMEAERRRKEQFGAEDSEDEVDLQTLVVLRSVDEGKEDDGVAQVVEDDGKEDDDEVEVDGGADDCLDSGRDTSPAPRPQLSRPARTPRLVPDAVDDDSDDDPIGGWAHDESSAIYRLPSPVKPHKKYNLPPDAEIIEISDDDDSNDDTGYPPSSPPPSSSVAPSSDAPSSPLFAPSFDPFDVCSDAYTFSSSSRHISRTTAGPSRIRARTPPLQLQTPPHSHSSASSSVEPSSNIPVLASARSRAAMIAKGNASATRRSKSPPAFTLPPVANLHSTPRLLVPKVVVTTRRPIHPTPSLNPIPRTKPSQPSVEPFREPAAFYSSSPAPRLPRMPRPIPSTPSLIATPSSVKAKAKSQIDLPLHTPSTASAIGRRTAGAPSPPPYNRPKTPPPSTRQPATAPSSVKRGRPPKPKPKSKASIPLPSPDTPDSREITAPVAPIPAAPVSIPPLPRKRKRVSSLPEPPPLQELESGLELNNRFTESSPGPPPTEDSQSRARARSRSKPRALSRARSRSRLPSSSARGATDEGGDDDGGILGVRDRSLSPGVGRRAQNILARAMSEIQELLDQREQGRRPRPNGDRPTAAAGAVRSQSRGRRAELELDAPPGPAEFARGRGTLVSETDEDDDEDNESKLLPSSSPTRWGSRLSRRGY